MLTGELLRARVAQKNIRPSFIKADDPKHLDRAEQLLDIYRLALDEGWTRGQIDEAAGEVEGDDTDIKLVRGVAKVLQDRAEFAVQAPLEPIELRRRVFEAAARRGPLARSAGPLGHPVAADVLAEVAAALGCEPEQIARGLYADLKDEQVLTAIDLPEAGDLLQRYNVALAQSMLLKASWLRVRLEAPDPKRVRQLYRTLKFHGLMYRVARDGADVVLDVDGPASLLQQASRYGLQLALFFPSLLLLPSPWRLEAELRWGVRGLRKALSLSHEDGLVGQARDTGAWRSRAEEYFEARFRELDTDWTLGPGEPLDLGGQELLVPDFTLRNGDRVAHLDIVGWWRKAWLKRRLSATPSNVVLAVSRRMAAEAGAALPEQVVSFAEVLSPKAVLERVERVAIRV